MVIVFACISASISSSLTSDGFPLTLSDFKSSTLSSSASITFGRFVLLTFKTSSDSVPNSLFSLWPIILTSSTVKPWVASTKSSISSFVFFKALAFLTDGMLSKPPINPPVTNALPTFSADSAGVAIGSKG